MQGIKATTEIREPNDRNNSSTARSDQRENRQWSRGILSTWELPTHLSTPYQMLNKQLHLLFPTHEMWELPTLLIAANKPSNKSQRCNKLTSVPQLLCATITTGDCHNDVPSTQIYHPNKLGAKSDAYANRLNKGFASHTSPASSKCSKTISKRSVSARGVQRYHSYFNRSCLPSEIEEDKLTLYCSVTTDLTTTAEHNHTATTADVTTAERQHSAMTRANY
ncbi:hypothetical protein F511_19867 [Dorcoceras hygrometricum]|uniref:Uncharacterized protein n=1 Tax=Dorcoceras hygrometricum TaxID=472368 RepID=A0A2Z7AR93_9LAMI|nr:hypothetical protein F511_19867 [Dorcoceras hygrometricum]